VALAGDLVALGDRLLALALGLLVATHRLLALRARALALLTRAVGPRDKVAALLAEPLDLGLEPAGAALLGVQLLAQRRLARPLAVDRFRARGRAERDHHARRHGELRLGGIDCATVPGERGDPWTTL